MKFDQISKDLLAGARYIEQHGLPPNDPHPLRALFLSLMEKHGHRGAQPPYHLAADRLHDACGLDNMDLSPEEAIDALVAAAYWHVPQAERKTPT